MIFNKEEMKYLGVFGIYKESYKIITTWSKIFLQIALAFILPTYFIIFANIQISNTVFANAILNQNATTTTTTFNQTTQLGTANGTAPLPYNPYDKLFSSEYASFWLFQAACFITGIIFSLFSTSAGIYTVARIHTGQEVTFKQVISVVPKVWKRLMVTFLCTFVVFAAYTTGAMLVAMLIILIIVFIMFSNYASSNAGLITGLIIITVLYVVGFVYMALVWQLANVVSVLEDVRGFKAMKKSKELLKGNMWVAIIAPFMLGIVSLVVRFAFWKLVLNGWYLGTVDRVGYGIVCSMLLIVLSLFGSVMETVLYFVCKSYHNENVDKLALSDRLDQVYVLGDYVPLKPADDVQLEKCNHV
ncbi:hypothetical protein FNV43_RR18399 [Rhamnella rubrinervis]|uniref:Transmembrane protein n=1 Tax=Rhamnella rubrinervis TaxID=2594499 RepID=A0A8K0E0P2_9ROSA|nr:hypothetical protein FNV43_RR18399 [Rhamnella rubrinervis]